MSKSTVFVCSICGSDKIRQELSIAVSMNSDSDEWGLDVKNNAIWHEDYWCPVCEDHTGDPNEIGEDGMTEREVDLEKRLFAGEVFDDFIHIESQGCSYDAITQTVYPMTAHADIIWDEGIEISNIYADPHNPDFFANITGDEARAILYADHGVSPMKQ